ncbi:MAG: ArsR/SmtB family transcription factor [Microbacterium sp.]
MHALDILGDPVRRRILELLAEGERSAGEIGEVVQREFGISQPAVSQHLRVLRESGFATARPDGTRRLYALDPEPLSAAAAWFDPFRRFWQPHLDALGTELARGRRQRRRAQAANEPPDTSADSQDSTNSTNEKPTTEPQED